MSRRFLLDRFAQNIPTLKRPHSAGCASDAMDIFLDTCVLVRARLPCHGARVRATRRDIDILPVPVETARWGQGKDMLQLTSHMLYSPIAPRCELIKRD